MNMPRNRKGTTHSFKIENHAEGGGTAKGFLTVNEDEDGNPIEVFLRLSKQGSTLGGFAGWISVLLSKGLQNGVPMEELLKTPMGMKFEPFGSTNDPEIPDCRSIADYVCRRIARWYMSSAAYEKLLAEATRGVGG